MVGFDLSRSELRHGTEVQHVAESSVESRGNMAVQGVYMSERRMLAVMVLRDWKDELRQLRKKILNTIPVHLRKISDPASTSIQIHMMHMRMMHVINLGYTWIWTSVLLA